MTSNLGRKVFLVTEKLAFARIAMSKLSNTQEMSILTQISTGSGDCCIVRSVWVTDCMVKRDQHISSTYDLRSREQDIHCDGSETYAIGRLSSRKL